MKAINLKSNPYAFGEIRYFAKMKWAEAPATIVIKHKGEEVETEFVAFWRGKYWYAKGGVSLIVEP